jgi:uncharacterized protein
MQRTSRHVDLAPKLDALRRRHQEFEDKLERFAKRHYLSPDEENEVRRLKTLKLHAKDEMEAIGRKVR